MSDNISPEEKLLKLIKGGKKTPSKNIPAGPSLDKNTPLDLPKNKGNAKSPSFILGIRKYLTNIFIHNIILLSLSFAGLYLLISLLYPLIFLKKIKMPAITQTAARQGRKAGSQTAEGAARSADFYMAAAKGRTIFKRPEQERQSEASSITATDLFNDISLVGIITGQTPQAIIEDKKNQKTLYVTEGQFINEYQVKQILEGKIILNYENKNFELHL